MRYHRTAILTAFLLALADGWGHIPTADAKESYKDEAGRVVYTIDDDGIVSMFENSPTDLTISVTRGTREQMQPKVTEVKPTEIPAGSSTVLRLRGENLVGATVKLSQPGIEVGAYAGKPKSLDLPISVSPTVPQGEVGIEVTTPIGSTKVTVKITDVQIGGGKPTRRDSGGQQAVSTAAPTSCPAGMVGVAAERGGFCIELDQTFSGDARKAEKTCAAAGKRLCTASEWRTACEAATSGHLQLKNMIGDWEWTGTQIIKELPGVSADYGASGELNAVLMGQSDCKTNRDYPTWRTENIAGRCCK